MTKDQALGRVAAILAFDSFNHCKAAEQMPNLRDNMQEALITNRETSEALGILDSYLAACSLLNVNS